MSYTIKTPTTVLKDVAEFIDKSAAIMEREVRKSATYNDQVPDTVDMLIAEGLVAPTKRAGFIAQLTDNPVSALTLLAKAAKQVRVSSLGQSKAAAPERTAFNTYGRPRGRPDEAFEAAILGGNSAFAR